MGDFSLLFSENFLVSARDINRIMNGDFKIIF